MSWTSWLLVAFVAGLAGLLLGGFVATRIVDWHRISSFEGKAGYFVVLVALLAGLAGAAVGAITAHFVGAGSHPSTLRALLFALVAVTLLAGGSATVARLLADVAPEIDGQPLLLAFEIRWPAGASDPTTGADFGVARLGRATADGVLRPAHEGPVFVDQARLETDRWIVPGAAPLATESRSPTLEVALGDRALGSVVVPLSGRPRRQWSSWSDWLPHRDARQWRFRIVRADEPLRVDRIGSFEVETRCASFYRVEGSQRLAALSRFRVRAAGEDLEAGAVAVIGGGEPALLVQITADDGDGRAVLLRVVDGALRRVELGRSASWLRGDLLTGDPVAWRAKRSLVVVPGFVDHEGFATSGLYEVAHGVLDTRDSSYHPLTEPDGPWRINGLPSATLSPDQQSFVWYAQGRADDEAMLGVTQWRTDRWSTVAIDRARMRFNAPEEIGPEWVAHHYDWQRGERGLDVLTPRAAFTPLPYRGVRSDGFYTLRPGGAALRDAMVSLLVEELGGARQPDELDGYYRVVQWDDVLIKAALGSDGVTFTAVGGAKAAAVLQRVADHLDGVIARGRHDALFSSDR